MGKIRLKYLSGNHDTGAGTASSSSSSQSDEHKIYVCKKCLSHCGRVGDVISGEFTGRTGKAYLISNVINISLGPTEEKMLMTGMHKVSDIYCLKCFTNLGWTYIKAFQHDQKYKEGKYILEKARIRQFNDSLCDEKALQGGNTSYFNKLFSSTGIGMKLHDKKESNEASSSSHIMIRETSEEEHEAAGATAEEEEEEEEEEEDDDELDESEAALFERFHRALMASTRSRRRIGAMRAIGLSRLPSRTIQRISLHHFDQSSSSSETNDDEDENQQNDEEVDQEEDEDDDQDDDEEEQDDDDDDEDDDVDDDDELEQEEDDEQEDEDEEEDDDENEMHS